MRVCRLTGSIAGLTMLAARGRGSPARASLAYNSHERDHGHESTMAVLVAQAQGHRT
jgi:hypothetical protein